jgi:hypothetical protein
MGLGYALSENFTSTGGAYSGVSWTTGIRIGW